MTMSITNHVTSSTSADWSEWEQDGRLLTRIQQNLFTTKNAQIPPEYISKFYALYEDERALDEHSQAMYSFFISKCPPNISEEQIDKLLNDEEINAKISKLSIHDLILLISNWHPSVRNAAFAIEHYMSYIRECNNTATPAGKSETDSCSGDKESSAHEIRDAKSIGGKSITLQTGIADTESNIYKDRINTEIFLLTKAIRIALINCAAMASVKKRIESILNPPKNALSPTQDACHSKISAHNHPVNLNTLESDHQSAIVCEVVYAARALSFILPNIERTCAFCHQVFPNIVQRENNKDTKNNNLTASWNEKIRRKRRSLAKHFDDDLKPKIITVNETHFLLINLFHRATEYNSNLPHFNLFIDSSLEVFDLIGFYKRAKKQPTIINLMDSLLKIAESTLLTFPKNKLQFSMFAHFVKCYQRIASFIPKLKENKSIQETCEKLSEHLAQSASTALSGTSAQAEIALSCTLDTLIHKISLLNKSGVQLSNALDDSVLRALMEFSNDTIASRENYEFVRLFDQDSDSEDNCACLQTPLRTNGAALPAGFLDPNTKIVSFMPTQADEEIVEGGIVDTLDYISLTYCKQEELLHLHDSLQEVTEELNLFLHQGHTEHPHAESSKSPQMPMLTVNELIAALSAQITSLRSLLNRISSTAKIDYFPTPACKKAEVLPPLLVEESSHPMQKKSILCHSPSFSSPPLSEKAQRLIAGASNRFHKDLRAHLYNSQENTLALKKLDEVLNASLETLKNTLHAHPLTGSRKLWDVHIANDLILLYELEGNSSLSPIRLVSHKEMERILKRKVF